MDDVLSLTSELIITAFIKTARLKMLDAYMVRRGDSKSGEIFLRLNNLSGQSKIYSYRKSNIKSYWENRVQKVTFTPSGNEKNIAAVSSKSIPQE